MFDLRQFAAISPEWYQKLQYHGELGSTNDEARRIAEEGAEHGTVVLADHQLAGRGRRGSSWVSGPGDGLLFSIILRPGFSQNSWCRIALATGLGVVTAINDKWGIHCKVKWPNDIYLRDRKCAGILAEAREDYVVVGVGLNVIASPGATASDIATIAVGDVVAEPLSRELVFALVLDGILTEIESCADAFDRQLARLRDVCYLTAKTIEFSAGGDRRVGLVKGIGADGSLLVEVAGRVNAYSQAAGIRCLS
ncbi:MAG: biotin--[acetyl-CoA-carboxylase] ligase [Akkermansiaceae bacterium]|nr:biotin--[acetyl-CoA-carboxylase] ligase [Akkermansiaceae bacterium]